MVGCLDGPAKNTTKKLASTHCVESGTLQNALSNGPRTDATYGNLLSNVTKVTTDRGDPMLNVIPVKSRNKDQLDADH